MTTTLIEKTYLFLLKNLLRGKKNIILALDWKVIRERYNFLSISWVLDSGHSIPLFFSGYEKGTLGKGKSQTTIESKSIETVIKTLGFKRNITVLADRGFDSPAFLKHLEELKVKYVIRICSAQWIYFKNGKKAKIGKRIIKKGDHKKYNDIKYTGTAKHRCNLYIKWQENQKVPWFLLSNINVKLEKICGLYSRRWSIDEMFKSLKNEDVGFNLRKVRLRHFDRWLSLLFVATIFFQAIGMLGFKLRQIKGIEKPYTMSSKPSEKQNFIFSIFNIAILIIFDKLIRLRYSVLSGFQIRWPDSVWLRL